MDILDVDSLLVFVLAEKTRETKGLNQIGYLSVLAFQLPSPSSWSGSGANETEVLGRNPRKNVSA